MPTYVFRCPVHGQREITRRMDEASLPCYCQEQEWRVGDRSTYYCNHEMTRVYTPPRVQNLSASENTLRTWGRDLRVDVGVTDAEGLLRERRARDEALAREGAPAPRAATIDE
jgi:hypothetical protein